MLAGFCHSVSVKHCEDALTFHEGTDTPRKHELGSETGHRHTIFAPAMGTRMPALLRLKEPSHDQSVMT